MKTLEQIELQEVKVGNLRADIYSRQQSAIRREVIPFFQHLTPEVELEFGSDSIYFKIFNDEKKYLREIFSLYLKQSWSDVTRYKGIDLSYYTTSTSEDNKWELKRLQILGNVAGIVLEHGDIILARINSAVAGFRAELDEVYEEMHMLSLERSEVQNAAYAKRRMEVIGQLCGKGVVFNEAVGITLKRDYTIRVGSIKVQSVSKSEKTCTVVGLYPHGGLSFTEERVDFERLITQVIAHQNIQSS